MSLIPNHRVIEPGRQEINPTVPLVYVNLGGSLPNYAADYIRYSQESTGLKAILLADSDVRVSGEIETLRVQDIYDYRTHQNIFANLRNLDAGFRNGFWRYTLERFFVLREFIAVTGSPILHAELDVLLFRDAQNILGAMDTSAELFVPRDSNHRAIASVALIRTVGVLDAFMDAVWSSTESRNEMEMLGRFLSERTDLAIALPDVSLNLRPWPQIKPQLLGNTLWDAAALGQWLFGPNPLNFRWLAFSRFINESANSDIQFSTVEFDPEGHRLWLSDSRSGARWSIGAVHVHSKITIDAVNRLLGAAVLGRRVFIGNRRFQRFGYAPRTRFG